MWFRMKEQRDEGWAAVTVPKPPASAHCQAKTRRSASLYSFILKSAIRTDNEQILCFRFLATSDSM